MLQTVDFNTKPDEARLFLCKPDRTTIAELSSAYDRRLTLNYGGIHQLSFRLPFQVEMNHKFVRNPQIDLLRGHYLVRYEKGSSKVYFIVTNPRNSAQDGKEIKDVDCYQLPYELRDKSVRSYKGTKRLYDPAGLDGVLNDTLLAKTDWKVGYIDGDIATKFRTFDVSEQNLLEFILELSETYGGIITWDTVKKEIHFYKDENLGTDEGLSIEYGKYLKSIEENENFDDVVTRLSCFGKDGLSINGVNPTGSNYIESYDFYMYPFQRDSNKTVLSHSHYMSDSLCHALLDYQKLIAENQNDFSNKLHSRKQYEDDMVPLQVDMDRLKQDMKLILKKIDVAIVNNLSLDASPPVGEPAGTPSLNTQKANKQSAIDTLQARINSILGNISNVEAEIATLKSKLSVQKNFAPAQITEWNRFIKEKSWTDGNIADAKELYEAGRKKLLEVSQPIVAYQISSVDFTKALNNPDDWGKMKLGGIVTIRYPHFNIDLKTKVITIDHNIDGNDLSLTIANTKDIKSGFLKLKDLISRNVSTSTTLDMSKYVWDKSDTNESKINGIINNKWNANRNAIVSGTNESYTLDERGFTLKDPNDPNNYLRMLHSILAFTNDGGNTFKHAITPSGIVGEYIYGKIFAGVNLTIDASDSQGKKVFTVDSTGVKIHGTSLTIMGGLPPSQLDPSFKDSLVNLGTAYNGVVINAANGLVITKNDNTVRTVLNATEGLRFQKSAGGGTWTDKLYYNTTSGNLVIDGEINARALKVNGADVLTSGGKIKALAIENLEVGTNVAMGPNAIISWSQISNQPYIPALPGYIQPTQITGAYIASPNIFGGTIAIGTGNNIFKADTNGIYLGNATFSNAPFKVDMYGKVTASNIEITGGSIKVGTNVTVGNNIVLTGGGNRSIVLSGTGSITFSQETDSITISSMNGLAVYGSRFMYKDEDIATQKWVSDTFVPKFG